MWYNWEELDANPDAGQNETLRSSLKSKIDWHDNRTAKSSK